MRSIFKLRRFVIFFLIVLINIACESSSTNNESTNNTNPANDPQNLVGNTQISFTMDIGVRYKKSSHVEIESIKMLVKKIKFENINEDSLDFKAGPYVVTVDQTGLVSPITANDLPAGSYSKVKFKIHKPEDDEVLFDSSFQDENGRYSMIITGTSNGLPFTFKLKKSIEQKLVLNPPLVVSDSDTTAVNATIIINKDNWFVDNGGLELDPSNEQDVEKIEQNIKKSFKAFKDRDHDGDEHDEDDDGDGEHDEDANEIEEIELLSSVDRIENGEAKIVFFTDSILKFKIEVKDLSETDTLTVAHIHQGASDTTGMILITLVDDNHISFTKDDDELENEWEAKGIIHLTAEQFDILNNSDLPLYINVHSKEKVDGLLRGQVRE